MTTIQGIYIALFGRPADPAGLSYFNTETGNGADLTVIGDLAGTDEYKSRFTGMEPAEIVNSIYQSLFERDAIQTDLDYWLEEWDAGRVNINDIAIRILDGAKDEDLATVNLKIAAAELFTSHLDLDIEKTAYNGRFAESVGRDYIDAVTTAAATGAQADTAILRLFPDQGQGPGGGGSNPGGGGGVPTFTVDVIDGVLTFGGTASGDVEVRAVEGQLIFTRATLTAVLNDPDTITSVQNGITLNSGYKGIVVFAHFEGEGFTGWSPVLISSNEAHYFPAESFYGAVKNASNVLLTSDFDTTLTPAELQTMLGSFGSGDMPDDLLGTLSDIASFFSAFNNVAIAAADGANTSLLPTIQGLLAEFGGELPSGLGQIFGALSNLGFTNLGLPVLLDGGATHLSADSLTGFTLVGNIGAIKEAATIALGGGNLEDAYTALHKGSSDTLIGGDGADIFLGLGDKGRFWFEYGQPTTKAAAVAVEPGEPVGPLYEAGDLMTGGAGKDVFIHIELSNLGQLVGNDTPYHSYSDGFDVITDFKSGEDTLLLVLQDDISWIWHRVDADGDGEENDVFIQFAAVNYGDTYSGEGGILLKDYEGYLAGPVRYQLGDIEVTKIVGSDEPWERSVA